MNNIWIPAVEVETNAGVREVALTTKHLMERRIFLNGAIDTESVNALISQLLYLDGCGEGEINLYINSGGGQVNAGLLLYDVLQGMKCPVNMYCLGMAASMAAVILASGEKGRRFILPHSKTMIHEPLISEGVGGSATSIKNISDNILETKKLVNGILAKHTGKPSKEIDKSTAYDHYMNAEESVAFGICDKIVYSIN